LSGGVIYPDERDTGRYRRRRDAGNDGNTQSGGDQAEFGYPILGDKGDVWLPRTVAPCSQERRTAFGASGDPWLISEFFGFNTCLTCEDVIGGNS
jgi:hypothetical protein